MPHAVARRMSRIYSSIVLIAMNSGEESDMATFFALDLGLALVAKTCPYRPQAFKKVNNGQAFPYEENICFFIFSWTSRLQVLQGMSQKNSRKYSKTWLRRVNIASWLTPKVYPILKLRNYKATTQKCTSFPPKSPKAHTPRLRDKPWYFGHVFFEPLPSCSRFFFFS